MLSKDDHMNIQELQIQSHKNAKEKGFWDNPVPGNHYTEPNIAEKLCLIHSEVSEALEVIRNENPFCNSKFAEELADVVIRVADLAGHCALDLEGFIVWKLEQNKKRPYKHGKKF
jgi:NTP pyrophosphatase (non-canonical NTP hydrolase)